MKKIFILLSIFILSLSVCFFVFEKNEFSENENRYLAVFPEFSFSKLLSGEFILEFDLYINDHFPFRDFFLKLNSSFNVMMGQKKINSTFIGDDDYLFLEYNNNFDSIKNLNSVINSFVLKNLDVDTSLILVPSSGFINSDKMPMFTNSNLESEHIDYISSNTLSSFIDVFENLKIDNDNTDVYYKLDHHYNYFGAYSVYKSFMSSKSTAYYSDLPANLVSSLFYGTLTSKTNLFNYDPDLIYAYDYNQDVSVNFVASNLVSSSLYDESYLDVKDKYSYYLGGNHALVVIETSNTLGDEIVIVKDSYANSFIPFLINHYSKIHVIDLRFYNMPVSEYLSSNNIDELLLFYSSSGFNNESRINLLR